MTSRKKKRRRQKKIIRAIAYIVMITALIVGCIAGWKLYSGLHDNKEAANTYEEIRENAKTETDEEDPDTIDFEELRTINPDIAGWIQLEDSSIDYPFVYASDNDYYLEHTFDQDTNHHGTIFIDCRQAEPFTDTNTVLYGHHMFDGSMFADVENYKDSSYYASHKVIQITTPSAVYDLYPVAGCLFSGSDDYVQFNFAGEEDFSRYIQMFLNSTTFTSEASLAYGDHMMLLSTCSYDFDDGRYVLIGKLVQRTDTE